jgi:hypothetical protein
MIKIPRDVHVHECAHDIYTKYEGSYVSLFSALSFLS